MAASMSRAAAYGGAGSSASRRNCPLLVEKLPRAGAVEAADPHRGNEGGVEIAEVHTVLGARLARQRLPVSDTPADVAADVAERAVTPDVFRRGLRMPGNSHCAELEIDPRPPNPPAQRAIASGGNRRRGRKREAYGAAMTGTLMHGRLRDQQC
jgi:hypothetical protein